MHRKLTPFYLLVLILVLAACAPRQSGEPTTFNVKIENVGQKYPVLKSGAIAIPAGQSEKGPLLPGDAYEFTFTAPANTLPMSGMRFNFATMFVQSNDLFYSFAEDGLALFGADGSAVTGDVPAQLALYDAGTEVDEEPGVGPNQVIRQAGPNTGQSENDGVMLVGNGGFHQGYSYAPTQQIIRVTVTPK